MVFRREKTTWRELNPKDGVSKGSIHAMERANGWVNHFRLHQLHSCCKKGGPGGQTIPGASHFSLYPFNPTANRLIIPPSSSGCRPVKALGTNVQINPESSAGERLAVSSVINATIPALVLTDVLTIWALRWIMKIGFCAYCPKLLPQEKKRQLESVRRRGAARGKVWFSYLFPKILPSLLPPFSVILDYFLKLKWI